MITKEKATINCNELPKKTFEGTETPKTFQKGTRLVSKET